METVALLCFKEPLGNEKHRASHYLGSAKDLDERKRPTSEKDKAVLFTNNQQWEKTIMLYEPDYNADKYQAVCWANKILNGEYGDWVVLDSQTTGLGPDTEIIELAILSKYGSPLLNTLIKPTCHLQQEAKEFHGITEQMLANAPTFPEVYPQIVRALTSRHVVIDNSAFDYGRLSYQCSLHGLEMPKLYTHCAMGWYAQYRGDWSDYYGNYRWQKLPGKGNRAFPDALATYKLIKKMATPLSRSVRFVGDLFPQRQLAHQVGKLEADLKFIRVGQIKKVLQLGLPQLAWMESNLRCLPDYRTLDDDEDF